MRTGRVMGHEHVGPEAVCHGPELCQGLGQPGLATDVLGEKAQPVRRDPGQRPGGIDAGFEDHVEDRIAIRCRVDPGAGGAEFDHGRAQGVGVGRGEGDGEGVEGGHGRLRRDGAGPACGPTGR